MIIKGLFRRYERWNPVHPTSGAFWGMGVGIGCGVGWGPGYGPEVVGYVGAGCGIGFCVGITLAGVGIGLPANSLISVPYNAFAATGGSAMDFARSSALPTVKSVVGNSLSYIGPILLSVREEACGKLSSFKVSFPLDHKLGFAELKKTVMCHARSSSECLETFRDRHLPPKKGS